MEDNENSKRIKFKNLLQGNYLDAIQLEAKLKKGITNINSIFIIICALLFIGMLYAAFLFLHLYVLI